MRQEAVRPLEASSEGLVDRGEMAARIQDFDWSKTPLGPPESWSAALRTTVGLITSNRFPMLLWWGPDYISIYNDAYVPILGLKHPDALGLPVRECWSEIWDVLKPLIDTPFNGGPSTWIEDFELHIRRSGTLEETHFTVAYSPVPDPAIPSGIGGVLATVHEISQKVVAERRVAILRDLGIEAAQSTVEDTCRVAMQALARRSKDIPFALLYLVDADGKQARLAGTTGVEPGKSATPLVVPLDPAGAGPGWPLAAVAQRLGTFEVRNLAHHFDEVPAGPWDEPPHTAVIVPLPSGKTGGPSGFLIGGVSSRLKLDSGYRGFYELAASHIAAAVARASAHEEERKRAEALAEIDRAKTAFFSNVSHEFRTPLTLMLGPIEELKHELSRASGDRSGPACQQVDLIQRNGLRLLKLVNMLLDFSRIEAGRARATYEATDLPALTAELASVFRSAIESAGLRFEIDCPPISEPAYVDREMWEKIVLNLVSNAFKFTLDGAIEVGLRNTATHFELTVRDTGTGIPVEELPKLFDRFYRVAGSRGRTHEGSGIGLALVQELVRLHGGTVTAESASGEGSLFRVCIPRGASHLPSAQIGTSDTQTPAAIRTQPFIDEALRWLPDARSDGEEIIRDIDVAEPADGEPAERSHILLVDDNVDMRDYVQRLLGTRYDVAVAEDGEAALSEIERRVPDLVLSDIMMPRLDGLGLLARLRSDPRTGTLPVILLSARAGEEAKVEGLQTGADDYLIKPFTARELLTRIESHLKMSRYRTLATETLRASEERFRAFVTTSSDVIYRMSPDWLEMRYLRGNAFIADSENPSEGWLTKYVHADDRPRVMAAIGDAIRNKAPFELEHRVIRPDGAIGWTHSHAVPILGPDGEIAEWFGAARDITERKRAEETQQLLLSELNHRVKNTLASVQAIAHQMLRRNKDPAEFVAGFSGRIQSLSRVHTMLSATTWQGVELHDLIRDQLLAGVADEARVTASGPPVHLDSQLALHIALMLHELGTNALKYGSLSAANGRVSIGWTVSEHTLHLKWEERGGPAARPATRRGFGTTLIEHSAKGEGGDALMSIEAGGVAWHITLPLREQRPAKLSTELVNGTAEKAATSAGKDTTRLAGKRVLVVEDEPLLALDIELTLQNLGAEIAGSARTAKEALGVIGSTALDAALLDANLRGHPVDEIAAALAARNIPFVFVTGYGREGLPKAFARTGIVSKPFSQEQLIDAVTLLLDAPAARQALRR